MAPGRMCLESPCAEHNGCSFSSSTPTSTSTAFIRRVMINGWGLQNDTLVGLAGHLAEARQTSQQGHAMMRRGGVGQTMGGT